MTGEGQRPIPVWTTNRGLLVMLRMALSQQGRVALPASSLAEFRRALDETRPRLVIAAAEDVAAAGLDPVLLERLVGETTSVLLLSSARPLPEPPGPRTRVLPVPFTTRDLHDALGAPGSAAAPDPVPAEAAPPPPSPVRATTPPVAPAAMPSPDSLAELVRREVDRVVAETARQVIEETVRRVVPELAEAIIRAELAHLLKESDEAALATSPDSGDDR